METTRFKSLARALDVGSPRRGVLALVAGSGLSWLGLDTVHARKKRKKKKKCGKVGRKPVKGKCCARSVLVDGTCRACDVCSTGCVFDSVQAAIDAADPGDTIALCAGTYGGNLTIAKDLRLVGAGDGPGSANTTLQGASNARVVKTTAGTIVLQNLRLTGGGGDDGCAVYIQDGAVELNRCTVSGNTGATGAVAVIYNNGSLELIESTVSDNEATTGGGIFNNTNRSLKLTNSEIRGNSADIGAGIYNLNGATVVFDAASRVTGNTASVNGGGIYNNGGTVTLVSSANVSGNTLNNCAGTNVPLCVG